MQLKVKVMQSLLQVSQKHFHLPKSIKPNIRYQFYELSSLVPGQEAFCYAQNIMEYICEDV